ncbi:hypothetical protein DPMN_002626 [Dreissena polymorpha]|uniref:Uncharacterized protein n=1 Tax=Dreissena polymorpha TaxID=45954 RepID=A0A9D4MP41_DREPO|nr:hypothetical protein DPMN_002626 [Dreissena polymorpha]
MQPNLDHSATAKSAAGMELAVSTSAQLPLRGSRLAVLLSQSTTYVAAQYLIRIHSTAGATAGLFSVQSCFYDDEVLQLAPVLAFASGSGSRPHGLWWSGQDGNVRQIAHCSNNNS